MLNLTRDAADNLKALPSLTRYPGGKNGAGVWHRIINEIPPHRCYIEAFAGSAAVFRRKLRAEKSILIDADVDVCAALAVYALGATVTNQAPAVAAASRGAVPIVRVINADCRSILAELRETVDRETLVYADPPYLPETRTKKSIYRHELDARDHVELLELLKSLRCMVMVSGYRSALYDDALSGWRRVDYNAQTRGGVKVESLWLNFPEPRELHDYRFLGGGFREREKWRRRMATLRGRLDRMPLLERRAMLSELVDVLGAEEVAGILTRKTAIPPGAAAPDENGEGRRSREIARAFL